MSKNNVIGINKQKVIYTKESKTCIFKIKDGQLDDGFIGYSGVNLSLSQIQEIRAIIEKSIKRGKK